MSTGALIEALRRRDVRLEVEGESLLIDAPAGFVTEELRKNLRRLKPELLAILRWEKCVGEVWSQARVGAVESSEVGHPVVRVPAMDRVA